MKIDKPLILKLEKLAKLKLSSQERRELLKELNNILGMVQKLNELDILEIKPLVYLTKQPNGVRSDKVIPSINRQSGLKNAPEKDDQFFRVPKVIDQNK